MKIIRLYNIVGITKKIRVWIRVLDPHGDPRNKGFAALLVVIIIGAAALIIALNASLLGLGELDLGYTSQKGEEAFSIADGCMEELLRRIRINSSYQLNAATTTDFNIFANGSAFCDFQITDVDGVNTRRIVAKGKVGQYTSLIRANASLSGPLFDIIAVTKWEEVPR